MENLKRVIERYIQTKNTFYALLINGDWGCGKTFFIKANYLKNKLKQDTWIVSRIFSWIGAMLIDKKNKKQPYQFCYISLNGLTKTDDIMAQFTAELLSARDWKKKFGVGDGDKQTNHFLNRLALGVTKNAKSIFDKALDKVGFKFENIIEFFEHGNCVIFIDDLERCKLPIEETLGYINTHFVEHAGLKIIFLANEREITSHDKNQTYQTIKEKIIGRTIDFEATLEENLISIVGQYSDELQHFVKKYKDIIINVISLAEPDKKHNLRTLQFFLECFEVILQDFAEIKFDYRNADKWFIPYIYVIVFYLYEYKMGKIKESEFIDYFINNSSNDYLSEKYSNIKFKIYGQMYKFNNEFWLILINHIKSGYLDIKGLQAAYDFIVKHMDSYEKFAECNEIRIKLSHFAYNSVNEWVDDLFKLIQILENNAAIESDILYNLHLTLLSVIQDKEGVRGAITDQEWMKQNLSNEQKQEFIYRFKCAVEKMRFSDTGWRKYWKESFDINLYVEIFGENIREIIENIKIDRIPIDSQTMDKMLNEEIEIPEEYFEDVAEHYYKGVRNNTIAIHWQHLFLNYSSGFSNILISKLQEHCNEENEPLMKHKLQKTINLLSVKLRNTERK